MIMHGPNDLMLGTIVWEMERTIINGRTIMQSGPGL